MATASDIQTSGISVRALPARNNSCAVNRDATRLSRHLPGTLRNGGNIIYTKKWMASAVSDIRRPMMETSCWSRPNLNMTTVRVTLCDTWYVWSRYGEQMNRAPSSKRYWCGMYTSPRAVINTDRLFSITYSLAFNLSSGQLNTRRGPPTDGTTGSIARVTESPRDVTTPNALISFKLSSCSVAANFIAIVVFVGSFEIVLIVVVIVVNGGDDFVSVTYSSAGLQTPSTNTRPAPQ